MQILKSAMETISAPDYQAMHKTATYIASLTKPLGSLGQLEEIVIRLTGIFAYRPHTFNKKAL